MREIAAKQSQLSVSAPGTEVLTMTSTEKDRELGMVSLYADIPNRGLALSFVRLNLYAMLSNNLCHVASVLCPAGATGEMIAVSGHVADSWHVYAQATQSRQDLTVGLSGKSCCAPPKVAVRADLLALAFSDPEVGLGELKWFPVVPWGESTGASETLTVAGSGTLVLPAGARVTHWQAQATAAGTITFDAPGSPGVPQALPNGVAVSAFPAAPAVAQIRYVNLTFGLFDVVV